jgi:ParB-like chromosome segregation protein Spo0J
MRLTEIKLDANLWPRSREDKDMVDYYAAIFEELPPIVIQKGTGKLIDGWHRFYAASKLGVGEVQVEEVDVPDNLVFAEAVKRNLKHGLPLKQEEREEAVTRLKQDGLSIEKIASVLGISDRTVQRILKARRLDTGGVTAVTLPLAHRVVIADAPPEKQPEIAKAVIDKRLTEKEAKRLVEAMTSPLVTEEDRDAMLRDPITRPYLRDEKGEKIQSLDSVMREMDTVRKLADTQATVKFWKTLQQLDKELSAYRPEEIAHGIEGVTIPLALETANSITRWFEAFKLEGAKLGYWTVSTND